MLPEYHAAVDIDGVRTPLLRAARTRSAAALVTTPDTVVEVSVAPGARWVVRSHSIEWVGGPDGLRCWEVIAAGARPITHTKPAEWVHPAVGLLWPDLLPVWGRIGDSHRPARVIAGAVGPGQLVLTPLATTADAAEGALDIDPTRWLCLRLELPDAEWALHEYRDTPARAR